VQEKFVHVAEVKVCEYVLFGDQVLPVLRCVASTNKLANFNELLWTFTKLLAKFGAVFFFSFLGQNNGRSGVYFVVENRNSFSLINIASRKTGAC
jgi:hypothetical protein